MQACSEFSIFRTHTNLNTMGKARLAFVVSMFKKLSEIPFRQSKEIKMLE